MASPVTRMPLGSTAFTDFWSVDLGSDTSSSILAPGAPGPAAQVGSCAASVTVSGALGLRICMAQGPALSCAGGAPSPARPPARETAPSRMPPDLVPCFRSRHQHCLIGNFHGIASKVGLCCTQCKRVMPDGGRSQLARAGRRRRQRAHRLMAGSPAVARAWRATSPSTALASRCRNASVAVGCGGSRSAPSGCAEDRKACQAVHALRTGEGKAALFQDPGEQTIWLLKA